MVKDFLALGRLGFYRAFFVVLLVYPGLVLSQQYSDPASTPVEARDLLQRMVQSQRQYNYSGLFTYEHGGALETFSLEHWFVDGVEYERLSNLAGPKAAIVRRQDRGECQAAGGQLLKSRLTALSEHAADDKLDDLSRFYQLRVVGRARVANREGVHLQVRPRFPDRYGLSLVLDEQTGLLLKAMLVNIGGQPLERFQFLELTLGGDMRRLIQQTHEVAHTKSLQAPGVDCSDQVIKSFWALKWLPKGFVSSGVSRSSEGELMHGYTDGLVSFSVFVSPERESGWPTATIRRGATSVYMSGIEVQGQRYRVTIVGELPLATLEQVFKSVYRAADTG